MPGSDLAEPAGARGRHLRRLGRLRPAPCLATARSHLHHEHVNAAGWYDLPFARRVSLHPGTYWMGFITGPSNERRSGFRYDSVSNSRAYNANAYTAGPTNPFGAVTTDIRADLDLCDLHADRTSAGQRRAYPRSREPRRRDRRSSASTGSWSESPSAYAYQWQRCDAQGANCSAIPLATAQSYTVDPADVGSTLRVSVTAIERDRPVGSRELRPDGRRAAGSLDLRQDERGWLIGQASLRTASWSTLTTLLAAGSVSKLSVYCVSPGSTRGAAGAEGRHLRRLGRRTRCPAWRAASDVTYREHVNAAGWYDLPFATR